MRLKTTHAYVAGAIPGWGRKMTFGNLYQNYPNALACNVRFLMDANQTQHKSTRIIFELDIHGDRVKQTLEFPRDVDSALLGDFWVFPLNFEAFAGGIDTEILRMCDIKIHVDLVSTETEAAATPQTAQILIDFI